MTSETALVTGASAGLGRAFAKELASRGFDLKIVARRKDRLEELASEIEKDTGRSSEVIVADLTKSTELAQVESAAKGVEMLVNNAGFGGYMPFVELTPEAADDLVRVHVLSAVRLTRAALEGPLGMVERGKGAVINVASRLAFSESVPPNPIPYRAVYAASKSFLVVFSQQLHFEVHEAGVNIQALCPGVVRTEFHEVAGRDVSHLPAKSPEEIVQASLAALDLGEVICIPELADDSMIDAYHQAQRAILQGSMDSPIAPRYLAPSDQ